MVLQPQTVSTSDWPRLETDLHHNIYTNVSEEQIF